MFNNLFKNAIGKDGSFYDNILSQIDSFKKLVQMSLNIAKAMYSDPQVVQIIKDGSFDMVVVSQFFGIPVFPLAWHFNATLTTISPSSLLYGAYALGDSDHLEYVPNIFMELEKPMTLSQRVFNVFNIKILDYFFFQRPKPEIQSIVEKLIPGCPPIDVIENDVSLCLTNSHPIFHYPRTMTPEMIEIGGIHCKPAKPLPPALDKFVGNHEAGFIMFAVGSAIQMSDMPPSMLNSIINVFQQLPQRIIWQWKGERNFTLPDNVMAIDWLPQQDLLGHRNCRLFLTHGGLNSLMEAVYHGVPVLGMPLSSDQFASLARSKREGYALTMKWKDVNYDSLLNTIQELLNNPKYSATADKLSTLMRDQPQNPLERAVYWTEFNLRHKGAKHLRLGSRYLAWYERAMIDVYGIIAAVVLLPIILVAIFVRKCCCSKKTLAASDKKKQ